jgi:RNA polymerase sigma-70 factor (ECF subfamily)
LKDQFLKLLTEHQGIVHHICTLYANNLDDRKDLFQEITFQLWKSFRAFRNESKFSTWLYRVSLNTAITRIRRRSKISFVSLDKMDFMPSDDSNQMDEEIIWLYQSISKLSKVDRAIIMLYLEEKSYEEIADILGITTSNVGVRINRIKLKLEKLMGDS